MKVEVMVIEKPSKDLKVAANYPPISLVSICLELLGRIMETVKDILSPNQAGLCKKNAILVTRLQSSQHALSRASKCSLKLALCFWT